MESIKVDLPEFDGYDYTGEYRPPQEGEYYFSPYSESAKFCESSYTKQCFFILKPIKVVQLTEQEIEEIINKLEKVRDGIVQSCDLIKDSHHVYELIDQFKELLTS